MWIIKKALDLGSKHIQSVITIKIMAEANLPEKEDLCISRNLGSYRPMILYISSSPKINTHRCNILYKFLLPKAHVAYDQG